MKRSIHYFAFLMIAIAMVMTSCNKGKKGGASGYEIFGEKSGIVQYKPFDMMGVKMTQTLYFDEYGAKEMRETVIEGNMMGTAMKQHSIDIRDGNISYHYELENSAGEGDMAKKEAYKMVLPAEVMEQMNISGFSDKIKTHLDYKEEGKETVAGVKGVKYSIAPDSLNPTNRMIGVHYKNVPLKIVMGQLEMVAEKVEFDVKIPAEKFKVPEGYTIIDEKQMMQQELPGDVPEPQVDSLGK
ncbi:MAG TPA: hypothetical protein PLJ84_07495 [Bacteroidales bacterium]|nr:hypothetical protein [Bacteroidales bacterium]HPT02428.1 hypothetical protein [Bacteroidales bacterium]